MKRRLFPAQRAQEPGDAGFTLIEMLVVVSIIGILAAVAIPRYMAYAKSSKAAEVANTAGALVAAITAYADSQGSTAAATLASSVLDYDTSPTPATDLTLKIPGFAAPTNSKFNYTITVATGATGGPQANDSVFCIIAKARANTGLTQNGVVVWSSASTTATDWDGRVNRKLLDTATTGAPTITAGGYCSTAGAAQAAYN